MFCPVFAFFRSFRRAPTDPGADLFARRATRWGLAVVTLALLGILAAFVIPAQAAGAGAGSPARQTPLAKAPAKVKLGGVSYTEARALFVALGYSAAFNADTGVLTLRAGSGDVIFTLGAREARVNGLRVFLGEPILAHKGLVWVATLDLDRLLLPILRPAKVPKRAVRTIVIDAGHGGNDSGTRNVGRKLEEKTFTLDVAKRLERLLGDERWKVRQTRTDDRFIELPDRSEFANQAKADLFISIHFNAVANNPDVRGTETYVLTPKFQRSTSSLKAMAEDKQGYPGNRHDARSALLGYQMHRQLLGKLKSEDRGLKRARFAVLRFVDCPGVLVEAGYLSNNSEAARIANADYRGDIAEALYAAILAFDAAVGVPPPEAKAKAASDKPKTTPTPSPAPTGRTDNPPNG